MIARIWRAQVDIGRIADYETFARERSTPVFAAQPGFAGVLMYRQAGDCTVITLWDSRETGDALSNAAEYQALVAAIRAEGFILEESFAGAFEVHQAVARAR